MNHEFKNSEKVFKSTVTYFSESFQEKKRKFGDMDMRFLIRSQGETIE